MRNVGLIVHRIIDIVEQETKLQRCSNRPGILGSAVVHNRVTDFLDVESLIAQAGIADLEAIAV